MFDDYAEHDDDDGVECDRCGTNGLHWENVWSKIKCREVWMLFDEHGERHVCPTDDAFDDLT